MTTSPASSSPSVGDEPTKRLAVLIDADNAQAAVIEALLEEVARFGEATVRRIYGDFTSPASASWKKFPALWSSHPTRPPGLATTTTLFFLASSFCEPIAPYTAAHDPTP